MSNPFPRVLNILSKFWLRIGYIHFEVCWGYWKLQGCVFLLPTPSHQHCRASQNPQPSRGPVLVGLHRFCLQELMIKFTGLGMGICNVLVPSPCNTNMTCGTVASPFLTEMKWNTPWDQHATMDGSSWCRMLRVSNSGTPVHSVNSHPLHKSEVFMSEKSQSVTKQTTSPGWHSFQSLFGCFSNLPQNNWLPH